MNVHACVPFPVLVVMTMRTNPAARRYTSPNPYGTTCACTLQAKPNEMKETIVECGASLNPKSYMIKTLPICSTPAISGVAGEGGREAITRTK